MKTRMIALQEAEESMTIR